MDGLAEELRKAEFDDIMFDIKQIEELRAMDNKHKYHPDWKDFRETIGLINKNCMNLVKEYEKKYGVRLHVAILKRIACG